ncbi:MAG TPA: aminotransferase class I/II-fold pyridoxal phosphate-dependent enzyme [Nitrososphaerales archaeon]|nr:aminotransferase class I/II-fold pyridoxal phosphate-dependent enzyme [Nitrososphaerales archaeon]
MSLEELEGSHAHEIFNEVSRRKAAGEDIVSLAIGEPSFATPPEIIEAAYQSMKSGATHYVGSYGIPELRDAISQKARAKNNIRAEPSNTMSITTKLAVYACLMAAGVAGGDVLVPDPGYFYSDPVIMNGGRPVRYPLSEDFAIDRDAIKKVATERTKAIMINTPSNPTGHVSAKGELEDVFEFCKEKGIRILSDESYEDLVYDGEHHSIGALEDSPSLVYSLFSLSKSFVMTGWRAGYVVASEKNVSLINTFIENTVTCFPPFIQMASAYAIKNGERFTEQFRDELKARRKMTEEALDKIESITYTRSQGTFYSFPGYQSPLNSTGLSQRLLRQNGLAVIPGVLFGPSGERHLRISFGASREAIEEGMKRLKAGLAKA